MHWSPEFQVILQQHLPLSDGCIRPDVPLADLGLDSLRTVSLVMELEAGLNISIPDDLLLRETFETASTLWKAVSGLLNQASAS